MKYNFIEIIQPIGQMYLLKMSAKDVIEISESDRRSSYNSLGIQRKLDATRVKDIANFCQSNKAMFPTPIILSANSTFFKINYTDKKLTIDIDLIKQDNNSCSIVDGQHRLKGIELSGKKEDFELLVMFIFDTHKEDDAYLFSVINGNQKPVSKSLIYDLYGLTTQRSIEKTSNYIINYLNEDDTSALKGKIKMLGIKDPNFPEANISQATLIDSLIPLITNSSNKSKDNLNLERGIPIEKLSEEDTNYIFRNLFRNNKDGIIAKILRNFFNAWIATIEENKLQHIDVIRHNNELPEETKEAETKEVEKKYMPFYKAIGFIASFKILKDLINRLGKNTTEHDFYSILKPTMETFFSNEGKTYSSSLSGASDLYNDIKKFIM